MAFQTALKEKTHVQTTLFLQWLC